MHRKKNPLIKVQRENSSILETKQNKTTTHTEAY